MVCSKCGAGNSANSWRCRSCYTVLREATQATDYSNVIVQSPLRQAGEPNISPLEKEEEVAKAPSSGTYPFQETRPGYNTQQPRSAYYSHMQQENIVTTKPVKSRMPVVATLSLIALVSVLALAYQFVITEEKTASSNLFAQAESTYNTKDLSGALALYQGFVQEHPKSHLTPLAQKRIEEIQMEIARKEQMLGANIETSLSKARAAYLNQRFLYPEHDNAILHTEAVLKLDPLHAGALEIQALVVKSYQEKAEKALKKRRYNTAMKNYRNILQIMPNDAQTLKQLESVMQKSKRR